MHHRCQWHPARGHPGDALPPERRRHPSLDARFVIIGPVNNRTGLSRRSAYPYPGTLAGRIRAGRSFTIRLQPVQNGRNRRHRILVIAQQRIIG